MRMLLLSVHKCLKAVWECDTVVTLGLSTVNFKMHGMSRRTSEYNDIQKRSKLVK